MTRREKAKNKAYKDGGHVGNGFDAGVNYAIETIEDRIKEYEDARSRTAPENSIISYTEFIGKRFDREINALRLIKYDLKK